VWNGGNVNYWCLINLKAYEPCWFLPCLLLASFSNVHASCRVGSNVVDHEDTPSFTKANPSSYLDQGKHQEYTSLGLSLLKPLLHVIDHLRNEGPSSRIQIGWFSMKREYSKHTYEAYKLRILLKVKLLHISLKITRLRSRRCFKR
jgi:hypothetical protein